MKSKFTLGMVIITSLLVFTSCLDYPQTIETTVSEVPIETTETSETNEIVIPSSTPIPTKEIGEYERTILVSGGSYYITNYCSCTYCCGVNAQGICADGTSVSDSWIDHSVAGDASIPFGTRFIIPALSGNEIYVVHDRGSAVNGNHFDIYQRTHEEALNSPSGYYEVFFIED